MSHTAESAAQLIEPKVYRLHPSKDVETEAGSWPRFFTNAKVHPFDEIEWKIVDARITDPKGDVVFEQLGVEVPGWWSSTTTNIVADKYFRIINGVKENSVKQMISRVSQKLSSWAEKQGYFNTATDAQAYEDELCYVLLNQLGAFNSPVWFNIGVPGRKQTASACFISGVEDTLEDIMEFQKSESKIFAGGSGSGASFSKLRSSYERLSSGSFTSGPLSWLKGQDRYAEAMKSGGSTRNAAKMAILEMSHPDILETRDGRPGFIRCKADSERIVRDLVRAGYSSAYDDPNSVYKLVPYQNVNHSVSIPDAFMTAVENNGVWHTTARTTGEVVHTYKARDMWNELATAAWECGDPGVQFPDTINEWHTTPKAGRINASNPCSEFTNVDNTACNLAALNLVKFFDDGVFNFERFNHTVRIMVTAQNAIISMSEYPTEAITKNSHKLRPIGLNYGNLGALIMQLGYGYDSDEGRAIAASLASLMTGCAYLVSSKLAAKVGAFPAWKENRDDMMLVMAKHADADDKICHRWKLDRHPLGDDVISRSASVWKEAIELGRIYGYSVSQASLMAPLGTISFLMGMDTTGVEPSFSLVSYKSMVGGGFIKMACSSLNHALISLNYSMQDISSILKYVETNDHIDGAPGLKPEHVSVFDGSLPSGPSGRCLSPMAHINMLAAIQPLITCAISKTVNMPETATIQDIADTYMQAWKLGVKCVALYRDKCKMSQPLSTKSKEKVAEKDAPLVAVPKRTRLPAEIQGQRHRFSISGYDGYIMMNEYPDGSLGEVFLKWGKTGSTISGLIDGFTQLLSLALQYGVPLDKMVRSFVHTKFEPAGFTDNPKVRSADSLYDYLFKIIDLKYFGGKNSGLEAKLASLAPKADIELDDLPPAPISMTLDAQICNTCGSIMIRAGTCHTCHTCGGSSGCS